MKLISSEIAQSIKNWNLPQSTNNNSFETIATSIAATIEKMYDAIPKNKRISYGIVHTVKELGEFLYEYFNETGVDIFMISSGIYEHSNNFESKAVALCILSYHGLKKPDLILPYFEKAAAAESWELREISQILFRKLIKIYPEKTKLFLLKLVKSEDPNVRRFVGETLRPVCENKWFYKQPDYSLSVIKYLFQESKAYPRTSAGNNLSDLARHLPDLVYTIVENLVESGDKNSYWIAYRACRNLVKKEPEKVIKLLKTGTYKYKERIHSLE
jgi:3-methyladenine DNA glycosylase AlkC